MEISTNKWQLKRELIDYVITETNANDERIESQYYHYTSLEVLFNILDGDSFWISNVRFSNDSTEERMIEAVGKNHDDYIICFCDKDDRLSQWRGYCHDGGVSIKFNIGGPLKYSVLHKDYETTRIYELYENLPLPVIYVDNSFDAITLCWNKLKTRPKKFQMISEDEMLPYIKNAAFEEERESRMAFMNTEGKLSNCIRFRTLKNGVKIPYMVVKQGDVGRMLGSCATDPDIYSDERIEELIYNHEDIWIEEGSDQEKVYYDILKKADNFAQKNPHMRKMRIFCKGHLPIEQITVAPTDDRERVAEQIKRFCNSKYWLQGVNVTKSNIPFIHH